MSLIRRMELMEPYFLSPDLFLGHEALLFEPRYYHEEILSSSTLDLFAPLQPTPSDLFDAVTDLTHLENIDTPSFCSYRRRISRGVGLGVESSYLLSLYDRVSALESKFDRLVSARRITADGDTDRKYTWTAEVRGKHADRKYKLIAEIKGAKDDKEEGKHHHRHHLRKHKEGKSYKWTAQLKDKGEEGPITRTYTWTASSRDADESSESGSEKEKKHGKKKEEKKKKKKDEKCTTRLVEIEEPNDHGVVALRQVGIGSINAVPF